MSISTIAITVPASGAGPVTSIATLIGEKTVELTGRFTGYYSLLGSHNDVDFVPVAFFNAGGSEDVKVILPHAIKSVKVYSGATADGTVTMSVSGVAGTNLFATLATLAPGASGPQASIDMNVAFPPASIAGGINVICRGPFEGIIYLEGSPDNVEWAPLGDGFRAGKSPSYSSGLVPSYEFQPQAVPELVRYIRVRVEASILGTVVITMGGTNDTGGSGGGDAMPIWTSDALAAATQAKGSLVVNEVSALSIAMGVGTTIVGTSSESVAIGSAATVSEGAITSIAIGKGTIVHQGSQFGIALGSGAEITGNSQNVVAIGTSANVSAASTSGIAIGNGAIINACANTIAIGSGVNCSGGAATSIALGFQAVVGTGSALSVVIGNAATITAASTESIAIGKTATIDSSASHAIAIGSEPLVQSAQGIAVGYQSQVIQASTNSICIGNGAVCREGTTSTVVIGSVMDARGVSSNSVLIGSGSSIINGTTCVSVGALNSTASANTVSVGSGIAIGAGSAGAIAIGQGSSIGAGSVNNIVVGLAASIGAGISGSQAYGASAAATADREVMFNSDIGGTTGVDLFHAQAVGGLDLLKFDVASIVNNYDTAMTLLYKNGAGTIVALPVTVDNVTGALTVAL